MYHQGAFMIRFISLIFPFIIALETGDAPRTLTNTSIGGAIVERSASPSFPTLQEPLFTMPFPHAFNDGNASWSDMDRSKNQYRALTLPQINLMNSAVAPNGSIPSINITETLASMSPGFPKNGKQLTTEHQSETKTNDQGVPIRTIRSTRNGGKPKITTQVLHPAEQIISDDVVDNVESNDNDYNDNDHGPPIPLPPTNDNEPDTDNNNNNASSDDNDNINE